MHYDTRDVGKTAIDSNWFELARKIKKRTEGKAENRTLLLLLPRDALVHSAVLRLHVVRLSVRPCVRL